jgi:hypothetical protein
MSISVASPPPPIGEHIAIVLDHMSEPISNEIFGGVNALPTVIIWLTMVVHEPSVTE